MQTVTARLLAIGTSLLLIGTAWAQDQTGREPAGAAAQKGDKPAAAEAKVGQAAPEFTLLDAAGKKHKLADYKDKVVVLEWNNFDCPFVHPTVMLRRDAIEKHRLRYDPAYCPTDDYELWSRAVRLFPAVNLDRVVLRYRVHAASLTQAQWGDMDAHATRIAARELAAGRPRVPAGCPARRADEIQGSTGR